VTATEAAKPRVAAIEGWFTLDDPPHLIGTKCGDCGTYFFPREDGWCRRPGCGSTDLVETELSRTGKVWSYTDAQYQPPAPFVPKADEHVPFAQAAVELAEEQLIVMGQVADGYGVDDLTTGAPVELVVEELFEDDEAVHLVWKWKPTEVDQ
jgi:uncharacterized OB-fold protein